MVYKYLGFKFTNLRRLQKKIKYKKLKLFVKKMAILHFSKAAFFYKIISWKNAKKINLLLFFNNYLLSFYLGPNIFTTIKNFFFIFSTKTPVFFQHPLNWILKAYNIPKLASKFNKVFLINKKPSLKFFFLKKSLLLSKQFLPNFWKNFSLLQKIITSFRIQSHYLKLVFSKNYNFRYQQLWSRLGLFRLPLKNNMYSYFTRLATSSTKLSNTSYYFFTRPKFCFYGFYRSRKAHFQFLKRRTLRNVSYKVLLKKDLKHFKKHYPIKLSSICLIKTLNFSFTWYYSQLLITAGIFFLKGEQMFINTFLERGDIFQIVNFYGFNFFLFKVKKLTLKKRSSIKKQNYISYLTFSKRWMHKKKNTIKNINFLRSTILALSKYIQFDYQTSSGVILFLPQNLMLYSLTYPIQYTSVLKLHSWNFRAT